MPTLLCTLSLHDALPIFVPGTTDIGNHTDDGTTPITLPFSFKFYGNFFTAENVRSHGKTPLTSNYRGLTTACSLTYTTMKNIICPSWDYFRTDARGSAAL